jgi:transcriptional regulator with XRE-family HTH domain
MRGIRDATLLRHDQVSNRGFTQDQFADATGLNRTHLYRLETGQQSMTLKTLKIVADALGVRMTQLLRGL